jgi:hypothetical protein
VIGPVASTPTVWRTLSEVGELQLIRVNAAVTSFRRHWWALLADRPQGFPWLKVAGRELTGITVVDLDASIVFAASDKENAQPTYKGGIGFCPNLATCDNTDDMLAIDPRPGGATSNCAKDNIVLLDLAVSRLPDRYRRWVLVRLDGAGFSHDLLEHIAAGGATRERDWEFSVGWSHRQGDGRDRAPTQGRVDGRDRPERRPPARYVRRRPDRPARPRPLARQDPRPADHRARRATAPPRRADRLARRPPPLPRPRGKRRKQAKVLGLDRWPSRHWSINVAWTQIVALAANLLACFRHLTLPEGGTPRRGPETAALPTAAPTRPPHPRATQTMAAPARGLALDRRPDQHLASGQGTPRTNLTTTTKHRRSWKDHRPESGTRRPDATVGPRPYPRTGNHDQNNKTVIQGTSPSLL